MEFNALATQKYSFPRDYGSQNRKDGIGVVLFHKTRCRDAFGRNLIKLVV